MDTKRNNSKKRRVILELLRGTGEHPSAETVYERVREDIPEISLGTVYRNLRVLEEDGLVKTVCTVDGQARYDARTEPHIHCVCRRCRALTDAEGIELAEIESAVGQCRDFLPESFELVVSGLCRRCREEEK